MGAGDARLDLFALADREDGGMIVGGLIDAMRGQVGQEVFAGLHPGGHTEVAIAATGRRSRRNFVELGF